MTLSPQPDIVHLPAGEVHYAFDKDVPPVLTIRRAEWVRVETLDARAGRVLAGGADGAMPGGGVNPITGPIAVSGARPGDALAVHIRRIEPADRGYTRTRPGHGVLEDRIAGPRLQILPVGSGRALFAGKLSLALRPMIGTLGVAPAGAAVPTLLAGLHGGNMDHNGVAEGAIVYLPVSVPGALLSLGDVHALMGDGEVTGTGLEVAAAVTLSVDLLEAPGLTRPWVRQGDRISTPGYGVTTDQAIVDASLALTQVLAARHDLSFEDAYLLLGLVGDGALCQTSQDPDGVSIVRIEVPWAYLAPWPEG